MNRLHEDWLWVWNWLTKDGASRATVILMFFTGWYVLMTRGMFKAMRFQTRAMVQPVLNIDLRVTPDTDNEKGYFIISNEGTQPLLLLDVRLVCRIHDLEFPFSYELWDKNVIAPQGKFHPSFDFTTQRKRNFVVWSPDCVSYNVRVVASDVNRQVVLTYAIYPDNGISRCTTGMPLDVRWRYFYQPFKWRYYRVKYTVVRWSEKPWVKRLGERLRSKQTSESLKGNSSRPDSGPLDKR
jgi:hypothetical protein